MGGWVEGLCVAIVDRMVGVRSWIAFVAIVDRMVGVRSLIALVAIVDRMLGVRSLIALLVAIADRIVVCGLATWRRQWSNLARDRKQVGDPIQKFVHIEIRNT